MHSGLFFFSGRNMLPLSVSELSARRRSGLPGPAVWAPAGRVGAWTPNEPRGREAEQASAELPAALSTGSVHKPPAAC